MNGDVMTNGNEWDRRVAEAASWRVTLSELDLDTCADFETWTLADPKNAEAWRHMQAVWDHFGANATAPELMTVRRETLDRASRAQAKRYRHRWRGAWKVRLVAAAVIGALILAGAGAGSVWYVTKPDVYRTAFGERRTVLLADGSRVALDSDTVLKVRLLPNARKLDLIQGQARFDVAHDASRPFEVHARNQTVVATGTSFNVDLLGRNVLVTLLEGHVSVLGDEPAKLMGDGSHTSVIAKMSAGQELITADADPKGVIIPVTAARMIKNVSLERTTAWEGGQLVFEDEPLSEVAQRVSRYAGHPINTEGAVGALKISGVFNAGDTATFVDTVQRAFPIRADQNDDGSVTLRSRS